MTASTVRVHTFNKIRATPGTWKLGVFWERSYAEIAQNRTKPPKFAENRLVQSLEPPEQLGCVPGAELYLKCALVCAVHPTGRLRGGQEHDGVHLLQRGGDEYECSS